MCVFVSDSKPKIAERNITCYKVLRRKSFYDSTPVSLYNSEIEWEFDKVFTAPDPKWSIQYDEYHKGWFTNDGLFYSYATFSDAENLMRKVSWGSAQGTYIITKCTIPKGAYYYYGVQGSPEENHDVMVFNHELAYASKKIIINDIINS